MEVVDSGGKAKVEIVEGGKMVVRRKEAMAGAGDAET